MPKREFHHSYFDSLPVLRCRRPSQDLENEHAGVPLKCSDPVVGYRETVTVRSQTTALSKSPNKHNRLWAQAEPLSDEVIDAIESGQIDPLDDPKTRARLFADQFSWDVNDARKIWAFGPSDSGANVVVDQTQGLQYVNDIKDHVVAGFKWATSEGVLAEEPVRGVRLNILDATVCLFLP